MCKFHFLTFRIKYNNFSKIKSIQLFMNVQKKKKIKCQENTLKAGVKSKAAF